MLDRMEVGSLCGLCVLHVSSYVSVVVERPSFLEVNSSRKFNQESEKG